MSARLLRMGGLAFLFVILAIAVSVSLTPGSASAAPTVERYLVQAKNAAGFAALRTSLTRRGATVAVEMPQINTLVVYAGSGFSKAQIEQDSNVARVAHDHLETLVQPARQLDLFGKASSKKATLTQLKKSVPTPKAVRNSGDPAFKLPGLMWNVARIGATDAWNLSAGTGIGAVTVGVADTGLDYTHIELKNKVQRVVDFSVKDEAPYPICPQIGLPTDAQLARAYGGPANTDWNGHGSWIGGNIAGALNKTGINGIAYKVKLVALKIAQNCGYAWDSTILDAFLYAADHKIDVVSISFGGYLDRTDPEQDAIWNQYVAVVNYAKTRGTLIVSAAGNEHVQVDSNGQVISHGQLTTPGSTSDDFPDLYHLWESPGGVPGVVDVSSTGNIVVAPSPTCRGRSGGTATNLNATCKPTTDLHQSFGINQQNQLSYFSNYGPRIDFAAPGGARKFNLPYWDRGGTPGFPFTTADQTTAFQDFNITSNWATEIPCAIFNPNPYFPTKNCYTAIQGTSMATPHVSAAFAVLASARPDIRHIPDALIEVMKNNAQHITGNQTPGLSNTDTTGGDLTGGTCPTTYCHLAGSPISDSDAYGAGLIDVYDAIK